MSADDIVDLLFNEGLLLATYFSEPYPSMLHECYEMGANCIIYPSPAWVIDGD